MHVNTSYMEFVLQIIALQAHAQDERILRECAFAIDSLFGMEFTCSIDRVLQTFWTKCMDRTSIDQIDPSFYDVSFLTSSVQHQRFTGTSPPCLLSGNDSFEKLDAEKSKEKKRKDKNLGDRWQINENKRMEWMLTKSTHIGEVFTTEAFKEVPDFASGKKNAFAGIRKVFVFPIVV